MLGFLKYLFLGALKFALKCMGVVYTVTLWMLGTSAFLVFLFAPLILLIQSKLLATSLASLVGVFIVWALISVKILMALINRFDRKLAAVDAPHSVSNQDLLLDSNTPIYESRGKNDAEKPYTIAHNRKYGVDNLYE